MAYIDTQDYRFMLESAKEHLDELQKLYYECLSLPEIPRKLTNKVRYFLSDIESALDYIAYAIFNKYCIKHITDHSKIESARKRVNFPLYDNDDYFHKRINQMFIELSNDNPKLIKIFEEQQPFVLGEKCWLKTFNQLVNFNKHRMLNKQRKTSKSHVHYMEDVFGNTFKNVTFENIDTAISYGTHKVKFTSNQTSPFINKLHVTNSYDFYFQNTNLSVLATLQYIYRSAQKVVNDLEQAAGLNT